VLLNKKKLHLKGQTQSGMSSHYGNLTITRLKKEAYTLRIQKIEVVFLDIIGHEAADQEAILVPKPHNIKKRTKRQTSPQNEDLLYFFAVLVTSQTVDSLKCYVSISFYRKLTFIILKNPILE
jgi:hypothetical protein